MSDSNQEIKDLIFNGFNGWKQENNKLWGRKEIKNSISNHLKKSVK